jgi:hypothetical protein
MKISTKRLALAIASAGLLTIYGCGGGGGSSASSATPVTVSGVAATGAAFTNAIITVTDKTGATVGTSSTPVGADGVYSITLTAGALAPFVLTASRTSADGAVESLVSVIPSTSGASATVNITPVTNLIASRLASSGDPLKLAAELAAGTSSVSDTTVASKVQEVQAILDPILTATQTASTNPLTGSFAVDGAGYDRLLDSIKVTVIPASSTTANIEVAIKQQLADGTAPTAIQFTNQTAAASIPAIATVDPTTLVPTGTATLIANHLAQLNACFALPTASRVNNPNPTGPAVAAATEANIIAPECRSAFMQDGTGTIQFKSNGATIGASTNKPFRGLFFDAGTGLVFSQGTYEFTRGNGDIVIGYRSVNAAGNETYDVFALHKDTDGKLKQIGNQYDFPGGVSAYQQYRQFITLNQSAFNYYSTGYSLSVNDVVVSGASIFDRVEVTTPKGNTLTLKPQSGFSYLVLVKPTVPTETLTGTNFVRLNSVFADATNTTDPALKDPKMFYADRTQFTDAILATLPAQSVWTFKYYLASAPATLAATQTYKTRARALTIGELQLRGFAQLSAGDIADVQANANSNGMRPIGGSTSLDVAYSVPAGALPPTQIQFWGNYVNASSQSLGFTDSATVGSTVRAGAAVCSPTGAASDTHCTGAAGSAYVASAVVNGAHLWARDPAGREYASFYALYPLAP